MHNYLNEINPGETERPRRIFDPFDKTSCVMIAPNRKDRKPDTVANERKFNERIAFVVLKTTAFFNLHNEK